MALERCDTCGSLFDGDEWHPAAFGHESDAIHQFCSEECKRAFFADDGDD